MNGSPSFLPCFFLLRSCWAGVVLRATGLEGLACCALIAELGVGRRDCACTDSGGISCLDDEKEVVKAGAAAMVTKDLTARERPP